MMLKYLLMFVLLTIGSVLCWPRNILSLDKLLPAKFKGDVNVVKYFEDNEYQKDKNKYLLKDGTPYTTTGNLTHEEEGYLLACVLKCDKLSEFDVVCATDYNRYVSVRQILCSRKCGLDLRVLQLSECPEDSKTKLAPLSGEQQKLCMNKCPSDGEYDPVCGTDNITYDNRDKLGCAQVCGLDIYMAKPSSC